MLEFFDTHRPISLHQCGIYERRCVCLSSFPEDPSTPVKADDHRGDGANGRTLSVGKTLIGWYIGSSAVASSYGAAGGLIVLLLWVYYSAQIFLFGAEFTKIYANTHGSKRRKPVVD